MSLVFKTFEEARDYIKKDPVGKSMLRLDGDIGYEVKSKSVAPVNLRQFLDDDEILSVKELKNLIGNTPKAEEKTIVDKSKLEIYKDPVSIRVRKKKQSYSPKKYHKKRVVSAKFNTKPFGDKGVIKPIEKRDTFIEGKVVHKSTLNIKLATHSPKLENKYPKQYIDEPLGTREDSKKMYGRQGAINRSNKS